MKIQLDDHGYQELETLIDIFNGMYFDDDEVQCFRIIKQIVDDNDDTDDIDKEEKEKIRYQLEEAYKWLESLNVDVKDNYLSYF